MLPAVPVLAMLIFLDAATQQTFLKAEPVLAELNALTTRLVTRQTTAAHQERLSTGLPAQTHVLRESQIRVIAFHPQEIMVGIQIL